MPALSGIGARDEQSQGGTGVVIGAGGMGKSSALDALARQATDRGLSVALVSTPTSGEVQFPSVDDIDILIVDDAHLLSASAFGQLLEFAEDRDRTFAVCVASRPDANHVGLGRLTEIAERRGVLHELGPFAPEELGAALTTSIDAAADASLFDAVEELTGGHPLIVDRLVTGWLELDLIDRGRVSENTPPAPPPVVRALSGPVRQLDASVRSLLAAIALASDHPMEFASASEDLQLLHSHGFLLNAGHMPPSIAAGVIANLEPSELEAGEKRLASELARVGADPVTTAEHFALLSHPQGDAFDAWVTAGDQLLDLDPGAAAHWYQRARQVDACTDVDARLAVAAAAAGHEAVANQAIGEVLRSEPRNPRTLGAGAQIAARHGRWSEAAELLDGIDEHPRWSETVIAVLGRGTDLLAERKRVSEPQSVAADPVAATLDSALTALQISLEHIPETAALTEAIRDLASRVGAPPGGTDLPLNAFELGAVAAVAAGELEMADVLLGSLTDSESVPSTSSLQNWLRVRTGGQPRKPSATEPADEEPTDGQAHADVVNLMPATSPYSELLDLAAEALASRRSGDVAASSDVLDRLRSVVALAPIDVLTFDAAAELMILARRFGSKTVLHTIVERLDRFLHVHEQPPLWNVRLRWAELEAAVSTRNIDLARSAADSLKEIGPTGPRLTSLIDASLTWIEVLEERADAEVVLATAADLEQSGFGSEAALLVGQAAIRLESAKDARRLLNRARELRGMGSTATAEQSTQSGLSDREIEVAELILDGHSYKEIGSRLFISAKTVEHHASHIRQKLDAVGVPRAVFLASLRADLAK